MKSAKNDVSYFLRRHTMFNASQFPRFQIRTFVQSCDDVDDDELFENPNEPIKRKQKRQNDTGNNCCHSFFPR